MKRWIPAPIRRVLKPVFTFVCSIAVWCFLQMCRLVRLFPNDERRRTALVLATGTYGSLGDEAIMIGVSEYLHSKGFKRLILVSYGLDDPWPLVGKYTKVVNMGAPARRQACINELNILRWSIQGSYFISTGADMMDGYYAAGESLRRLRFPEMARRLGLRAGVLAFSFNDQPHPDVVTGFRRVHPDIVISNRDPFSHQRLQSRTEHPIHLAADLAFLMTPLVVHPEIDDTVDWIAAQKEAGRMVIGINANINPFWDLVDDSVATTLEIYGRELERLLEDLESPLSLLLLHHDKRSRIPGGGDIELARSILALLPDEQQKHCALLPEVCTAPEIKAIGRDLDLCVTGRMHLAIACLGQGTPVGALPYQGKFEGLNAHFGIEGVTISATDALAPGALSTFISGLVGRREEMRSSILDRLPYVRSLSRKSLDLMIGENGS